MDINSLFKRAQAGDKIAHEELLRSLRERFRLFIHRSIWNKLDAEDVLQDTLLIVERKYRDLEVEKSFVAWSQTVLTNQIKQYFRKKKNQTTRMEPLEDESQEQRCPDTMSDLERKLLDCLHKMHRVNIRHARVINLHYQGFTTEEICRKFGFSRNNLYLLLFRARAMLKRCLETGELNS